MKLATPNCAHRYLPHIFEVHMNISFIFKVKILMLIIFSSYHILSMYVVQFIWIKYVFLVFVVGFTPNCILLIYVSFQIIEMFDIGTSTYYSKVKFP